MLDDAVTTTPRDGGAITTNAAEGTAAHSNARAGGEALTYFIIGRSLLCLQLRGRVFWEPRVGGCFLGGCMGDEPLTIPPHRHK